MAGRVLRRSVGGALSLGGTVLAASLTAAEAKGASSPGVDVRTWTPSVDPRASLVLEPPSTATPWVLSAGAWVHAETSSVVLRDAATGAVVSTPLDRQAGLDVVASMAMESQAALGVRVPVFFGEAGTGGLSPGVVSSGAVPGSGLGDVGVLGKLALVGGAPGASGVAALGEVGLPTGDKTSFAADRGPTFGLRLLGQVPLPLFSLQASAGYELRTARVAWPSTGTGGVELGGEVPWALGVVARPAPVRRLDPDGRQTWEVALHGSVSTDPSSALRLATSPVLLALSDRVALGHFRDGFVLIGVDLGLDRALGVPAVRGVLGVGWSFAGHDRDGDGIPDDVDACPTLPEDFDGFEDDDGCPEADNDDDGIVDSVDACPNVPGVPSPDPRHNGCPDPDPVPPRAPATAAPSVPAGGPRP